MNKFQTKILQLLMIGFWAIFWLLNVVDKFIGGSTFLWVGKDRFAQFYDYFVSIGIESAALVNASLIFVTAIEILALLFLAVAFFQRLTGNKKATKMFTWGTFTGLLLFTFFSIGDQVFGDRVELLEHSIYWFGLLVSLVTYYYFSSKEIKEEPQG